MAAKKHTVELKTNVASALFMAGSKLVLLDQDHRSFDAADEYEASFLVSAHDFLKASDRKQES